MKTITLFVALAILPVIITAQEIVKDAVVAPVKMNIFYRGVSNPVEIAVPGVSTDKISATVTNGTISKANGGWEIKPGDKSETVVTVLVNNKKVTEKTFRVKDVPDPVAVFAGKNEGKISRDLALKTNVLDVELKNFDWDLKFTVKSFVLLCTNGKMDFEETSDGNNVSVRMKSLISDCKPGQNIIFKDIKAIGPDGRSRDLNPVILVLQ
jgi:gliding motility-associated protein GldM